MYFLSWVMVVGKAPAMASAAELRVFQSARFFLM
jgi:hypothetical protein